MKNRRELNRFVSRLLHHANQYGLVYLRSALDSVLARIGIGPRVAQEGWWVFALRVLSIGLTFLTTVVLTRVLGVDGYGIYAYAYAVVMVVALPAEAGLPNLVVRETAQAMAQGQAALARSVWHWSARLTAIISIILAVILGLLLLYWNGGWKNQTGATFAWALALIPLIAMGDLRGAALRGLRKIVAGQIPEFLIRPGLLLFSLVALLLAGKQILPSSAMALNVLATSFAFVVGVWILLRNTPVAILGSRPTSGNRDWLASSILFALISGFGVVNSQASTVILGIFSSPAGAGIYRVAVQVSTLSSLGLQTVNMMVAPRFAGLYAKGQMLQLQRLVTISARAVLAFSLAFTLIFVSIGRFFFGFVFGEDFIASYVPLVILLGGQVLNSMTGSVGFLLNMTGNERDTALGLGISAGIGLILNFVLIPMWGTGGAALATSISMVIWNILLWWKVRQRLGINSLAFLMPAKV